MKFNTSPIPKRVFKGIFEIIEYVRELTGENDLSGIPDRINLKAISIDLKESWVIFSACADDKMPVYIQTLVKNNNVVQGSVHCGNEGAEPVKGGFSFDIFIDLFRDVRRIEEFVDTVKGADGSDIRQVVIAVYLNNEDMRITILKEGEVKDAPVIEAPVQPENPVIEETPDESETNSDNSDDENEDDENPAWP